MELLSKKDLLALTGISYGQLYRWKREKLIPEEWFIKKSSYTGQETFFPRDQVLSRVRSILDAKDTYSLEELAKIFSPEAAAGYLPADALGDIGEISPALHPAIREATPGKTSYEFFEVVLFAAVSKLSHTLALPDDEAASLLRKALSVDLELKDTNLTLTVFLSEGQRHLVFSKDASLLAFDAGVTVCAACSLSDLAGKLKLNFSRKQV